jgi:protein O-mannosyl-transferase
MKLRTQVIQIMTPSRLLAFFISAALVVLIWLVFSQTLRHEFVNYDDNTYVYGNSLTRAGLSWHGLARAFVDTQTDNWHPLTLISHMLDCQLFGLNPGAHHFTNVLLHTIASVLLFVFLRNVTARLWSSAFIAALFGIHPLRVESVVWIAERKDVLSAVFFFLTLIAYSHYVVAPSLRRYLMTVLLFALGLTSKAMLVTTPVVLLLLDYWPFRRFTSVKSSSRLVIEKIPLFGLSLVASIIALALQLHSVGQLPISWRVYNAVVSCLTYVWQIIWPVDLAIFYPHPEDRLTAWQVALASGCLIAVTSITFTLRRSRPYLIVGWLWYLVMLLPVIGIVQVGLQGHADRYTYLPHVGLYVAITYLIADLSKGIKHRKTILSIAGSTAVIALVACAWKQTTYWRNSDTLWTHALAVTSENEVANTNLGMVLSDRGQFDDALSHLQTALALRPKTRQHYYNLRRAIVLEDIGEVLTHKGELDDAVHYFRQSLDVYPNYHFSHYNLGVAFFRKSDVAGAIAEWQKVLSLQPGDPETLTNIAIAFVLEGRLREAMEQYEKALQSDSGSVRASNNLAWILATAPDSSIRDGAKAVALAKNANQISNNNDPQFIRTLAAAYAEAGQFDAALECGSRASTEADKRGQHDLAVQIQEEMDLYRLHLPLRDRSLTNTKRF